MKIILVVLLLISSSNLMALEIKNFKSGLACTDGKTFGWICHDIEKIYITGQGQCTYNKETVPCTWHGFEFDYKNLTKESEISCKSVVSQKMNIGNMQEVSAKDTKEYTFKLPLKLGAGHFFNPQYVGFSTKAEEPYSNFEQTTCYSEGKEIFKFKKEFIYPKQP